MFEAPEKPIGKPLRIHVLSYSITGVGTYSVGRVETGIVKTNDKVVVMPSGVSGEVKSIRNASYTDGFCRGGRRYRF